MKTTLFLVSLSLAFTTLAEVTTVEIKPTRSPKIQSETLSTANQSSVSKNYYQPSYKSNWEMRKHRKLGAGVGLTGIFGQIGGVADINFDAQNAAQVGFGSGYGYNTFFMGWKNTFESQFLSPYITIGYSRWYNSVSTDLRGNSYILDQVLSKDELSKGKIGVDLLLANFGFQYNQLDSEWIGNTFFIEFNFLFSADRGRMMPAASLGSIYYF